MCVVTHQERAGVWKGPDTLGHHCLQQFSWSIPQNQKFTWVSGYTFESKHWMVFSVWNFLLLDDGCLQYLKEKTCKQDELHWSPTPISSTAVAWSRQHSFHSKYPAVPHSPSTSAPGCGAPRCHQQLCTLDEQGLGKHVESGSHWKYKNTNNIYQSNTVLCQIKTRYDSSYFFNCSIAICKKHI